MSTGVIIVLLAGCAVLLFAQVVMLYLVLRGLLELRTGKDAGGLYNLLHALLQERRRGTYGSGSEEWGMENGRPVL